MFKGMIDRRIEQGYDLLKIETFANNNAYNTSIPNEGGQAWKNATFFIDLNPRFLQNIDDRMQYLTSKGMVVSIAQGVGISMKNISVEPDHKRLTRYTLARHGGYPTGWRTAQEFNDVRFGVCVQCWVDVAAYVYNLGPYKCANSSHNAYTNPVVYHDQICRSLARAILEDEANYEDVLPLYTSGSVLPECETHQSTWQSQIGGLVTLQTIRIETVEMVAMHDHGILPLIFL